LLLPVAVGLLFLGGTLFMIFAVVIGGIVFIPPVCRRVFGLSHPPLRVAQNQPVSHSEAPSPSPSPLPARNGCGMGWIIVILLIGMIWLLLPAAKKQEISDFFTSKVKDLQEVIEDSFKVKEPGVSIPDGPYKAIDSHALKAPKEVEQSISALGEYLTGPARTDEEKTRAIFRWMTDRIAYNAEDFLAGRPVGDCSAETVLKTRKSVCAGYANLFEQLAKVAGLEVVKISGHCKGYGYTPGERMSSNHAWNAVRINGQWYMMDVTWGAGGVEKEKGFIKEFDDYWFLTSPEQFIFSHFPDDPSKQFLTPPIEANTYQGWPGDHRNR
jgi:transglutaminase-like putative cysteine protease